MFDTKEYFLFREELLRNSVFADGTGYSDSLLLDNVLSDLLETKLIDSEDVNQCYFNQKVDDIHLKMDAWSVN